MRVVIHTDASFCPETRVAAWAAWIAFECGKKKIAKPFEKTKILGPTHAEIAGATNALYCATIALKLTKDDEIIIYTDCLDVIRSLCAEENGKLSLYAKECRVILHKLFKANGRPKIELIHVKAHTNAIDEISIRNSWCDGAARNTMRLARFRKKKGRANVGKIYSCFRV